MPQPVPPPITSTPAVAGMPYDPANNADLDRWRKLESNAGPADINDGHVTGSFVDSDPWVQV